jgi:tetratricopeptide (TPR) repeat protein
MLTHPVTQERIANVQLVMRSLGKTEVQTHAPDPLKKVQLILRLERREAGNVLEEFQKKVAQDPQDAESLHLLAYAQHFLGQLPAALKNYERARILAPGNPSLQRDLGRVYTDTANFSAAHQAFDQALALEPKEPLTYLYLGELLEKEKDLRAAAGAYLNAHQLSPLWPRAPYRLGSVYGTLDRLGDAYYYLGVSFLLQDEDERAITDFEKAIKIVGENSPRGQTIKEELTRLRARKR